MAIHFHERETHPPENTVSFTFRNRETEMILKAISLFLFAFSLSFSPVQSLSGMGPRFAGFDLGTSGARISVIEKTDSSYEEVYSQATSWPENRFDDPDAWMDAVSTLLTDAPDRSAIASMCISGTSASCLMIDGKDAGKVTRQPRMYNYDVVQSPEDPIYGVQALDVLDAAAPPKHTARSATGSLAKLLAWHKEKPLAATECLCHQSDYIALQFLAGDEKICGAGPANQRRVSSDWHNCLKLGYDVQNLKWPEWLTACLQDVGVSPETVLPQTVVSPGEPLGKIHPDMASRFGLPKDCVIVGGTTDSNAAFFAAVGNDVSMGTAVTSLGSTLAIKQLSTEYVEDATVGVYSHRFPSVLSQNEAWLVGGASNVGCAVLRRQDFSTEELVALSEEIDPETDTDLSYYPLTRTGERFPVADSKKEPLMEPVPDNRKDFLWGILQGISTVECQGFEALGARGASPSTPHTVFTSGGGSRNDMWCRMRQRRLRQAFGSDDAIVRRADNVEASFGAAILAAAGYESSNS